MIEDLELNSPLGKSDHSVIEYTFNCYINRSNNTETKLIYDKGNYEEMKKYMSKDWRTILSSLDVDDQWNNIQTALQNTVHRNVPSRRCDQDTHPLPMNNRNKAEIRKKHRMWSRYIETRDEDKKQAYNRQRNKVRGISRKVQRDKEAQIEHYISS